MHYGYRLHLTLHWRKRGQDLVTSAVTHSQLWFGAGLFLSNLSVFLSSIFLKSISTGQTIFKIPAFVNAERWQQFYLTSRFKIYYEKTIFDTLL